MCLCVRAGRRKLGLGFCGWEPATGVKRTVGAWAKGCPASAQTAKKLEEAIEPRSVPGRRASLRAAVLESFSPASRAQLRIAHRPLPLGRLSRGRKRIPWQQLPQPRAWALSGSPELTVLFSQGLPDLSSPWKDFGKRRPHPGIPSLTPIA